MNEATARFHFEAAFAIPPLPEQERMVEAVLFAVTRPRHVTLSIVLDAADGGVFPSQNA